MRQDVALIYLVIYFICVFINLYRQPGRGEGRDSSSHVSRGVIPTIMVLRTLSVLQNRRSGS